MATQSFTPPSIKKLFSHLFSNKKSFLVFFLLTISVIFLQYFLFRKQLDWGFTPDDWWPLFDFKVLPSNPISALSEIWRKNGLYTSYQVIYIGIIENFIGLDFYKYQLINHFFKFLSVISLYPLLQLILKRKLVAFLAVLLYGISYCSMGTLELVVRGSDFIAITFMNLFGFFYYKLITGQSKRYETLFLTSFLLILSTAFSPIRIYPLLVLIPLIELFILIKDRSRAILGQVLKRVSILYFVFLLALVVSPKSFLGFLYGHPVDLYQRVSNGNFQVILTPFASLGSILIPDWQILGRNINVESFISYMDFIFQKPLIIFFLVSLILALIISKKPAILVLKITVLNLLLEILAYFLITHYRLAPKELQTGYDTGNLHPILGGIFIISVSITLFYEWLTKKNLSPLLNGLWFGVFFSYLFITLTWIMADYVVVFKGVHNYLTIPAIGINVALASLMTLAYDKLKSSRFLLIRSVSPMVFLIIIPIFITSYSQIDQYVENYMQNGLKATEQQQMRDKVWESLKNYKENELNLFYIDTKGDYPNGRFYEQSVLGRFDKWMFLWGAKKTDSCLAPNFILENKEKVLGLFTHKDNKPGFLYTNVCGTETFFDMDHFYAIRLKDRMPIDIKQDFIRELKP